MRLISTLGLFKKIDLKLKSQEQSDVAEGGGKRVHTPLN